MNNHRYLIKLHLTSLSNLKLLHSFSLNEIFKLEDNSEKAILDIAKKINIINYDSYENKLYISYKSEIIVLS